MARVKRGVTSHAKHKKVFKAAKGFYGRRKNTIRIAKQAVEPRRGQRAVILELNRLRGPHACGLDRPTGNRKPGTGNRAGRGARRCGWGSGW